MPERQRNEKYNRSSERQYLKIQNRPIQRSREDNTGNREKVRLKHQLNVQPLPCKVGNRKRQGCSGALGGLQSAEHSTDRPEGTECAWPAGSEETQGEKLSRGGRGILTGIANCGGAQWGARVSGRTQLPTEWELRCSWGTDTSTCCLRDPGSESMYTGQRRELPRPKQPSQAWASLLYSRMQWILACKINTHKIKGYFSKWASLKCSSCSEQGIVDIYTGGTENSEEHWTDVAGAGLRRKKTQWLDGAFHYYYLSYYFSDHWPEGVIEVNVGTDNRQLRETLQ